MALISFIDLSPPGRIVLSSKMPHEYLLNSRGRKGCLRVQLRPLCILSMLYCAGKGRLEFLVYLTMSVDFWLVTVLTCACSKYIFFQSRSWFLINDNHDS